MARLTALVSDIGGHTTEQVVELTIGNDGAGSPPFLPPNTPPRPGPETAPEESITVHATDSPEDVVGSGPPGSVYWFEPHIYFVDTLAPRAGDTLIGAPGAVFDGEDRAEHAIAGLYWDGSPDVTIAHLEIRNYACPAQQGVLNEWSFPGWTIHDCYVHDCSGGAMMGAADLTVRFNIFDRMQQYALNGFSVSDAPANNIVFEGNEVARSGLAGTPGAHGGFKFWANQHVDVRDNWVHDNTGVGMWMDTNNNDFLIEGNLIEDNGGQAFFYEISYNAVFRYNTLRRNTMNTGADRQSNGSTWPDGSIYISESGGDSRVPARTDKLEIYGNLLKDNWAGITLWENADRFAQSPANTSGGCNLVMPIIAGGCVPCQEGNLQPRPYQHFWDCRWRTKNVDIHDNEFRYDQANIPIYDPAYGGTMAVFSNWGSFPDWSPYQGPVIQQAITFDQNNRWHDNTYSGPWRFVAEESSGFHDWAEWRAEPYSQDEGSTLEA